MVKVYSIPDCPWCHKVKKYLKAKGVDYEDIDVEADDAARDELYKISGDLTVPVTTVDGKNYVLSFDKEKLDALIGIK
jgi:glutaredoxin 3